MVKFDAATDIPDLTGQVCLVTGANSGLGEATAQAIAQHNPGKLYVASRSHDKGLAAIERIRASSSAAAKANIELLDLDLADFASVRAAASRVFSECDRLDHVQLNAGVACIAPALTKDGYEIHFGTNYMGHALLTQLLMPLLLSTAHTGQDVRVVSMSSVAHRVYNLPEGIRFEILKTEMRPPENESGTTAESWAPYGQANFAKVIFAAELARHYPSITTTAVCPGLVHTPIWKGDKRLGWLYRTFFMTPFLWWVGVDIEKGVRCQLWNAYAKREDVVNGACYDIIGRPGKEHPLTQDAVLGRKLWEWTAKELEEKCGTTWPKP
jgi:NAD(P)-dependent dehydrogenase (short-subunit alcohol dehydrogenase family)